jgi:uncharacterized protein (TIGR04255 family)
MMTAPRVLARQPLAEAIFELRWRHRDIGEEQLLRIGPATRAIASPRVVDPNHEILIGALNQRLRQRLPAFERLDAAALPAEFSTHQVQYRWRRQPGGYPLVQLGPGVLTVNFAEGYDWESFFAAIREATADLIAAHPEPANLIVQLLLLRYINAIEFDFAAAEPFAFLGEKMKFTVKPSSALFEDNSRVRRDPTVLDVKVAFPTLDPVGLLSTHIARGAYSGQDAFIWENQVESQAPQILIEVGAISTWAEAAHSIAHDWFFRSIEGELLESFR